MARPHKTGMDYFPMVCHIDDKIKLIQAEFGLTGFAVVVKLFQKIYGEQGYYCEWTKDVALLFSSENGLGCSAVSEIVNATIRRGIFDKDKYDNFCILTSARIQETYIEACSRRKDLFLNPEYLVIDVTLKNISANINLENANSNSEIVNNNKQKKVNNIKVNKNNSTAPSVANATNEASKDIFISMILNDNSFYDVPIKDVIKYKKLYPVVDVEQALRNMVGWLDGNPTKRKTRSGIKRFIW